MANESVSHEPAPGSEEQDFLRMWRLWDDNDKKAGTSHGGKSMRQRRACKWMM